MIGLHHKDMTSYNAGTRTVGDARRDGKDPQLLPEAPELRHPTFLASPSDLTSKM